MPIYQNALANRPANMLAYQDTLSATPRNQVLGYLADLAAASYAPQRTQQMQGMAQFLSLPAVAQTLDRLSYGEPLTTGRGMTTQLRPEAVEAAIAVAPLAQPVTMATLQAARAARQAAMATGKAGERYAERVLPRIMERGGMPAQLAMGMTNRTISPLDVYHGTPHRFAPTERNPLGEFDASKIGTGEGAQVYGHGLYVAEAPVVAQEYQKQLGTQMQYKGKQFYDPIVGRKTGTTGNTDLDDYLLSYLGDTGVIRKELLTAAKEMRESKNPQARKEYQALMADLRKVRPDVTAGNTGSLYKVDLPDEQIGKMLDFDKPLSEQSDYIKNIIKEYELDYVPPNATGGRLIEEMNRAFGPATASMHLRNAGIPGIKYFDEKSRSNFKIQNMYKGQPYGEPVSFMTEMQAKNYAEKQIKKGFGVQEIAGTRNFVVFPGEEKSMTILERDGQPANALVKNKTR
jgi:hypothetical protein